MGGDEFIAIVLTENPETVCKEIEQKTREWHGAYLDHISMAVGYAASKDWPGAELHQLEKAADESMYAAKERYYQENGLKRRGA